MRAIAGNEGPRVGRRWQVSPQQRGPEALKWLVLRPYGDTMSAIYRETSALSLVILVPLAACLFRNGRPKLRLMMPANSQSQGSVSLSSEMTCSEALRRHPERHLQSTLRPVAGDPCAPRRVLIQKKPPEVPSKKNVLLQVLLSTVQYSIADPPILSSSPRNGSRTARNGDM